MLDVVDDNNNHVDSRDGKEQVILAKKEEVEDKGVKDEEKANINESKSDSTDSEDSYMEHDNEGDTEFC